MKVMLVVFATLCFASTGLCGDPLPLVSEAGEDFDEELNKVALVNQISSSPHQCLMLTYVEAQYKKGKLATLAAKANLATQTIIQKVQQEIPIKKAFVFVGRQETGCAGFATAELLHSEGYDVTVLLFPAADGSMGDLGIIPQKDLKFETMDELYRVIDTTSTLRAYKSNKFRVESFVGKDNKKKLTDREAELDEVIRQYNLDHEATPATTKTELSNVKARIVKLDTLATSSQLVRDIVEGTPCQHKDEWQLVVDLLVHKLVELYLIAEDGSYLNYNQIPLFIEAISGTEYHSNAAISILGEVVKNFLRNAQQNGKTVISLGKPLGFGPNGFVASLALDGTKSVVNNFVAKYTIIDIITQEYITAMLNCPEHALFTDKNAVILSVYPDDHHLVFGLKNTIFKSTPVFSIDATLFDLEVETGRKIRCVEALGKGMKMVEITK